MGSIPAFGTPNPTKKTLRKWTKLKSFKKNDNIGNEVFKTSHSSLATSSLLFKKEAKKTRMNPKLPIFLCFLLSYTLHAQIGGDNTYEFLNLPQSARISAMGGLQIAIVDNDVNLANQNPALYNPDMHHQFSVGTVAYLANINYGNVSFAHNFDSLYTAGIHLQYINYGEFDQTDATGQIIGSFAGGEYALNIGLGQQKGRWSYGTNLKIIQSAIAGYNSFGLAADIGGTYYNKESNFVASLVVKNLGRQLTTYTPENIEPMPFDVQLGVSKRLKHLPFRYSITAHNLHRWDIRYEDPNQNETNALFGDDTLQQKYIGDKIFRHLVFGGEFYFGKNVNVRLGYNHLRRQELRLQNRGGLTGFSFGAAIHIKRFRIEYGRANYHLAGGAHHLTVAINLNEMKSPLFNKNKKKPEEEDTEL